jgi:hypothetical protein
MGFHLPFGDDDIPKFDIGLGVVSVVVIAGLVAWAMGWL